MYYKARLWPRLRILPTGGFSCASTPQLLRILAGAEIAQHRQENLPVGSINVGVVRLRTGVLGLWEQHFFGIR